MKIEVGKFYKSRNGRKVTIYVIRHNCDFEYPVCGYMEGAAEFSTWTIDGSYGNSLFNCSNWDIVSEWEEPKASFYAYICTNVQSQDLGNVKFLHPSRISAYLPHGYTRARWLEEPENKE